MLEPLRLLIVDDEPLARLRLRSLLEAMPDAGAVVAGEAEDADAALLLLRDGSGFDALLVDIVMPGRDGLKLASALAKLAKLGKAGGTAPAPAVIFVTAHAEHAVRAFELDAVDYLTKPVRRERLAEALMRVRQRRPAAAASAPEAEPPAAVPAAPATLVVSERGRVLSLPHDEVLYLRAGQKYVSLRTADHVFVIDEPLTDLEQRLGPAFIRIHRNAIVARRAIRALEMRDLPDDEGGAGGWAVRLAPLDEWLAVSRRQVTAVREALAARK